MTSNECCDDVGWRAYLGASQHNHDHPPLDGSCVHSANGFGCKLVAAFFLLKRYFSEVLRLRKREVVAFRELPVSVAAID
jgi:hypothetical protein